jgi:hypothetical protein
VIYAYMVSEDRERLKVLAAREHMTVSAFIRARVDEYLAAQGEPMLVPLRSRGRPRFEAP